MKPFNAIWTPVDRLQEASTIGGCHLHDVDADVDDHSAGFDPRRLDQLRSPHCHNEDVAVAQHLLQVDGVVVRLRRLQAVVKFYRQLFRA